MNNYLIDTEFIRATKDRVHFIEVAILDSQKKEIIDFHMDATLNKWEHRYFTRALNGHYGPRTKKVFEAVNVLYSGSFNRQTITDFCLNNQLAYNYKKIGSVYGLIPTLENSNLYAWDISNDKDLFKIINPRNVNLIDVQAMWREKFKGNQLSLVDAYKHVLYNTGKTDVKKLIDYAHYACCDVVLLDDVISFIADYEGTIKPIPIEECVRDKKIADTTQNINKWLAQVVEFEQSLAVELDQEVLADLSLKLIRTKRKISNATKRNQQMLEISTYQSPWW